MKRRIKKNISALLVALIAMFIFAEILLRLFLPAFYGIPPFTFISDDELNFIPNPSFEGFVINNEHSSKKLPISINADGFRDKSFAKSHSSFRLITIGDSETFPDTLLLEEQYGKVIEKSRDNVESLNFGVSGYGTVQSFNFFKRVGLQFKPDVVSYLFVSNDLTENVKPRYAVINGARVNYDWKNKPIRAAIQVFVYRHSFLAREVYRLTRGSSSVEVSSKLDPVKWDAMHSILQEMQSFFDQENIRFVVIINPLDEDNKLQQEIETQMVDLLEELNIEVINPSFTYNKKGGKNVFRWQLDNHLNVEGHKLLANEVINHLW